MSLNSIIQESSGTSLFLESRKELSPLKKFKYSQRKVSLIVYLPLKHFTKGQFKWIFSHFNNAGSTIYLQSSVVISICVNHADYIPTNHIIEIRYLLIISISRILVILVSEYA